jgi:hypothetical protein
MILTDGTNTITTNIEDYAQVNTINGNVVTTIGGNKKSQADSQYLKITTTFGITNAQYATLLLILANYAEAKFYTPTFAFPGDTAVRQIEVVIDGSPEISNQGDIGGDTWYFVKMILNEVIYGEQ